MTHFSDFSFVQRGVEIPFLVAYLFYSVYYTDRFKCLHPKRLVHGQVRSIVTYVILLAALTELAYDVTTMVAKYNEGYLEIAPGEIITKPINFWDARDQALANAVNYVESVTFALEASLLCLLHCFWNYLSCQTSSRPFMRTRENWIFITATIGNLALFPCLQAYYRYDLVLLEAIPQLAYAIELVLLACLGVRAHFRFNQMLKKMRRFEHDKLHVKGRVQYYREMNKLLSFSLFWIGACMATLSADGLTDHHIINSSKIASDLLICVVNVNLIFAWVTSINLVHPGKTFFMLSLTSQHVMPVTDSKPPTEKSRCLSTMPLNEVSVHSVPPTPAGLAAIKHSMSSSSS